jgi:hypothetical protein
MVHLSETIGVKALLHIGLPNYRVQRQPGRLIEQPTQSLYYPIDDLR